MDIRKQAAAAVSSLARWLRGTDLEHGGWRGDSRRGETAETDARGDHEQVQAAGAAQEYVMGVLDDMREALHENPAIAQRAQYWAMKYGEDRTRTVGERQHLIQERLFGEFPILGRKGARFLTQKATRDWAS